MASSNRHWPSMFKSKPCNTHHQWQHDINPALMPSACQRSPYTSVPGGEERSPEPKPRWNPKPEQIRILEAIFNSGMVNPPRDEIRKIRAQLQEYGQVGDANVFYWFQNRKSRSKHKQRHLHQTGKYQNQIQTTSTPITTTTTTTTATIAAPSSSSSSSEKSSPTKTDKSFAIAGTNVIGVSNSPTASVNQTNFQTHGSFLPEPFYFPVQQTCGGGDAVFSQEYYFSELSNVVQIPDEAIGTCSGLLLSELMMTQNASKKEQEEKMKMDQQLCYTNINTTTAPTTNTISTTTTINPIQGVGECSSAAHVAKSTVFINDVAFEVGMGPFNVREAFGNDVVLIHSSGQPVLTNEWGVTLQYLQHGAFYYLV